MKVLCLIPPSIPSYFNAGHRLPLFMTAGYLRKHFPEDIISCLDAGALNTTWKEICDTLSKKYDVIAIFNDYDMVDTHSRFMTYVKKLSPETKSIAFGRLSKQIPEHFLSLGLDAVHHSGDYEAGIYNYISYLKGNIKTPPGVMLSKTDIKMQGPILSSDQWVLPDVEEIPYDAYNFLYKNDLNKFCGIPHRRELVVPIARGCPIGCAYCDVPPMQGKIERRLGVDKTIEYINTAFNTLPFEYISFYAPTFTLNHKWVKEFCEKILKEKRKYYWKCVTVLKTLTEELIEKMANSGCIRISLGIESLTNKKPNALPKCKQNMHAAFIEAASLCKKYGIELNCFIILGLPGDTPEDNEYTIDLCEKYGARIRPTIYTPYQDLDDKASQEEVMTYNRQIFVDNLISAQDETKYYDIFYKRLYKETQVMHNIPKTNKIVES
jgi:anaerobic magnesium-protoporphyrin IX monomethyl ester cyclase